MFLGAGWQAVHGKGAAECVRHAKDVFKTEGGFAGFQFDNEAHAHADRQCQLRLCEVRAVWPSEAGVIYIKPT